MPSGWKTSEQTTGVFQSSDQSTSSACMPYHPIDTQLEVSNVAMCVFVLSMKSQEVIWITVWTILIDFTQVTTQLKSIIIQTNAPGTMDLKCYIININTFLHLLNCFYNKHIPVVFAYLSAISSFRFQVVESDKFSEQAALLVAPLDPPQFEIGLRFEQDEPQVDGKSCHVNSKRPVRIKHCFPSVHFASGVDLGGLVAQTSDKSYGPNGHLTCGAHLQRQRDRDGEGNRGVVLWGSGNCAWYRICIGFRAEVLMLDYYCSSIMRQNIMINDTVYSAYKMYLVTLLLNHLFSLWFCVRSAWLSSTTFLAFLSTEWNLLYISHAILNTLSVKCHLPLCSVVWGAFLGEGIIFSGFDWLNVCMIYRIWTDSILEMNVRTSFSSALYSKCILRVFEEHKWVTRWTGLLAMQAFSSMSSSTCKL